MLFYRAKSHDAESESPSEATRRQVNKKIKGTPTEQY